MFYKPNITQKWPIKPGLYLIGLLVFGLTYSGRFINEIYGQKVFPLLSFFLRSVLGKIPIATGEYLYIIILILLIVNLLKILLKLKNQYKITLFWQRLAFKTLNSFVAIYIIFELIWGYNYLKQSPAVQFNIQVPNIYTEFQMDSLSIALIHDLNQTRALITDANISSYHFEQIRDSMVVEYNQNAQMVPFLQYTPTSVKKSQFPSWGNYLGYNAFYQPLTGEAIVRADLPKLTLPFTIGHEMAHQLGYASEAEANFIAYVVATKSNNLLFKYSMQLEIFSYAQMAHLNFKATKGDYEGFKEIVKRNKSLLSLTVLEDRKKIKLFYAQSQKQLLPASTEFYNQFLQWNKQAKGINSYNDVLLWVLAYKNGE